MVKLGLSGSFRVRVGVKTRKNYRYRDCVDGTVASSATDDSTVANEATVPSRLRYRLDGTVACAISHAPAPLSTSPAVNNGALPL